MKSSLWQELSVDLERLARVKPPWPKKLALALTNRGFHVMVLYRSARCLRRNHIPLLPLLCARLSQFLFAVDISPSAELGPGIVIIHGFGLVIGEKVKIAGNCSLYHGVTLGASAVRSIDASRVDGHPIVESGVLFGAGAKVLGPIRVGRGSVIGANAVVVRNVPPHCVVAGVPARIIRWRGQKVENIEAAISTPETLFLETMTPEMNTEIPHL